MAGLLNAAQNEYAQQIRAFRESKPGKAHGKVFVKGQLARFLECGERLTGLAVIQLRNLSVPMPQETTAITCTLHNGIHYVTTPEAKLIPNCRIEQEFELYVSHFTRRTCTHRIV